MQQVEQQLFYGQNQQKQTGAGLESAIDYITPDVESVYRLLHGFPFLTDFLFEAERQIKSVFTNPKLYLKAKADPEIAGEERLEIAISPSETQSEAFTKLEQLDDNWWFSVADKVQDKLYITLE